MKNEYGAYIFFNESGEIDLFLYKKYNSEDLKNALPISFSCGEIKDHHNCLCAFFRGGYDYLGSGRLDDIPNIIKGKNMYNILDNSYEKCISNGFYKLSKKQFNNFIDYSMNKLWKS